MQSPKKACEGSDCPYHGCMAKVPKGRTPRDSATLDSVKVVRRHTRPYVFVLDALEAAAPRTRSMFGCLAIYVEEKIVFLLRDKLEGTVDNGVWIATTIEHHESLRRDFPHMRSIQRFGREVTGWQVLPADALDFEESAFHACELVLQRDPRIGKVPKRKRSATSKR